MALIDCPQCGKKVSDSAKSCPHCGLDLEQAKADEGASKTYHLLPLAEQKQLQEEFSRTDPCFKKFDRQRIILLAVGWVLFAVVMVGLIASLVWWKGSRSFSQEEYNDVVARIQQHISSGTSDSAACKELAARLDEMNAEVRAKDKPMEIISVSAAILFVPAVICLVIEKFGRTKQRVACFVKFRNWLRDTKGIKMILNPSPREKKYLNEMTGEKKWL